MSIYRNRDGMMWFGTGWGRSRYDGNQFVNFTTEDGPPGNTIIAIHGAHNGALWLGTWNGLCLYDGNQFLKFTRSLATSATDGLAGNLVMRIYHAADGLMWFGTLGNGAAGYDGTTWTSLDTRDGLANNGVWSIDSDLDGTLRFGTKNGLTFYRRSKTKPKACIVSVKTDRDYTVDVYKGLSGQAIPPIVIGHRVTIGYSSIDFKTVPEKRQYRTRIYESENGRIGQLFNTNIPYNPPTKKTSFDWIPEKPGTYTFEVQAIDRYLCAANTDVRNPCPPRARRCEMLNRRLLLKTQGQRGKVAQRQNG